MANPSNPAHPVTNAQTGEPAVRKPLRLWPGVALALLLLVFRLVVPAVVADAGAIAMLGGAACALLVVIWWLFFSRAPWLERVGIVALMIAAVLVTLRLVHM